MRSSNDPTSSEQVLDNPEQENSQTELIERLQTQIEQMRIENLSQTHTINSLQNTVTSLEYEVDDCEKDILELEDANSKLKKQIKALVDKNNSLTSIHEKLRDHYQASANSYHLPRRISFLGRNDPEDNPELDIPATANLSI